MNFMDPFEERPDLSRRRFLRYGADVTKNAAATVGTAIAAKTANDIMNPLSMTTFGKLPADTRDSLRLMLSIGAISPADREIHAALAKKTKGIVKSPTQAINHLLANEPTTRREALKVIGTTAALAPSGVSPVSRVNNLVQNIAEVKRTPLNMRPIRDAAILSQWDKIAKVIEQDINRRTMLKGLLTILGGRAVAKL